MTRLRDQFFPPFLDTSSADLIADFFVPALRSSVRYDRGVGFFSAGWLRVAAEGMAAFARNSGSARWVTSPILSEADWQALQLGEAARSSEVLRRAIERNLDDLERTLKRETLSALAWLVADGILNFKLALPRNKLEHGEFHDKFGIFTDDEGNQVSFNGSYNDSIQGTFNYESIKIFCSWQTAYADLVRADAERFECLWNNFDPNVRVFELPDAARERIVCLRTQDRPYPEPDWEKLRALRESRSSYLVCRPTGPSLPIHIELRDYQVEAVQSWFSNKCRGVLEMATGTGKTITALAAAVRLMTRENRLVLVIACPQTHLIGQWGDEVETFGFRTVMAFGSAGPWEDNVANKLLDFSAGYINHLAILTTHDTFSTERFRKLIESYDIPLLLIMDEVHGVGSPQRRHGLLEEYRYRLGLSATPQRWFDEEGTDLLFDFFDKAVFEFTLSDAIPRFLTPYEYYPSFVELTKDEFEKYQEMTGRIVRRAYANDDEEDEILKLYLIQRQQIIVNAENKFQKLEEILDSLDDQHHTLVYCSPEQINEVQDLLNARGIIQSRFTGEESFKERQMLLESFAEGHHKMLVAMKCLDEGVDVPATRTAILMASSGNPKQFIQRRGRVLRKAEGKEKAVIFDIIIVPTLGGELDQETVELERRILKRELQRYEEFSALALNDVYALNQVGPIKRKYLIE